MEYDRKMRQYTDAVERAAAYNTALTAERSERKFFWEQFTRLRHSKCSLWVNQADRSPGRWHGQVFSYPVRRWRIDKSWKVKDITTVPVAPQAEPQPAYQTRYSDRPRRHYRESSSDESREEEEDEAGDQSDYCEEESAESDGPVKVSRPVCSAKKKTQQQPGEDNSVICQMCGRLFKNQQGLRNHYLTYPAHEAAQSDTPEASDSPATTTQSSQSDEAHTTTQSSQSDEAHNQPVAPPNNYCDFCLGGEEKNNKTNKPERLISCADCGRSGHPSCLQFTDRLAENVRKYRWQCIECKSCGFCGNSDNDDQLLFCDDCDRGYHMFCLKPPINSPPEGRWLCVLCAPSTRRGRKRKVLN